MLDDRDITALPPQKRGFWNGLPAFMRSFRTARRGECCVRSRGEGCCGAQSVSSELARRCICRPREAGPRTIQSLSGGEQQRVARRVPRHRAACPLMDEPLSLIDPTLRQSTRDELRSSFIAWEFRIVRQRTIRRMRLRSLKDCAHSQRQASPGGDAGRSSRPPCFDGVASLSEGRRFFQLKT